MASHASGLGPEMAAEIEQPFPELSDFFFDDASDSTGSHADMTSKLLALIPRYSKVSATILPGCGD